MTLDSSFKKVKILSPCSKPQSHPTFNEKSQILAPKQKIFNKKWVIKPNVSLPNPKTEISSLGYFINYAQILLISV